MMFLWDTKYCQAMPVCSRELSQMLQQPEPTLGVALAVLAVPGQALMMLAWQAFWPLVFSRGSHIAQRVGNDRPAVLSVHQQAKLKARISPEQHPTHPQQQHHLPPALKAHGTEKNRSRDKQQDFREALIKRYSPTTQSKTSTVYCMLSHMELPAKTVKAAHLWKSEWSLKDPSLTAEVMGDEESWRNGLLLAQPLQDAFDAGHLCLVKKPNGVFHAYVLEQNLILRTLASRLDQGKSDARSLSLANFKLQDLVLKVHMDDDNQEEAGNWGLSEARLAERVRFGTPSWRERVELLFRAASKGMGEPAVAGAPTALADAQG
eukprot:TRINITY_DN7766_c0_g2_i1.p1 TRINITY_DN7766_c0_g2~~TRINITY_DN7766_c0_g2_i1.p1  ORF type:complete len:320 (+),score=38.85 TRINITY_DN7766_c0_g2_i1:436-1395(+)